MAQDDKLTPDKIAALSKDQLDQLAYDLKLGGSDVETIAQTLGISSTRAQNSVRRIVKRNKQSNDIDKDFLVSMEFARLEFARIGLAKHVRAGNVRAINAWVKIGEAQRKMMGLDAPVKFAPTTPDGEGQYQPFDAEYRESLLDKIIAERSNGHSSNGKAA